MVGRDTVGQQSENTRCPDAGDGRQFHRHALEIGRVLHVGRAGIPAVGVALGLDLDGLPLIGAPEHVAIPLQEHLPRDDAVDGVVDLLLRRPDVLQVHRLAVAACPQRLRRQIDAGAAGQRIGHHQRRAGQVVGADIGVHPALEVAVTRQHAGNHQVVVLDGIDDRLGQRPGIADAGGAAIAHRLEAHRIQILGQARGVEIVGHHLAARRQRGLHPGLRPQAAGARLARQQPGRDHHIRVRRVGAGGDGGDHHVAMAQIVIRAGDRHAQVRLVTRHAHHAGHEVLGETGGDARQQHPVLRPLRPGHRRFDRAHVQRQRVGKDRVGAAGVAPHALRAGIGLDQRDAVFVAARQTQVVDRHLIDREDAAGRAVFGRHVADGSAVGQRHVAQPLAVELDELADHALGAEHLRHRQHQVGGGHAFPQPAGQPEADDVRDEHRDGLAEHGRLRLDAAHAPAQHAQPVDHRGVAVGAVAAVGVDIDIAGIGRGPHHLRQVFQIDLVADAGAGRHDAEVAEGALAPAQELVALAITGEFHLDILAHGVGLARAVHHHRMVDDQIDRHQRVDLPRVAAERDDAVSHRGEIDHAGHAGKILHQDAAGLERHFLGRTALGQPAGDALRILHRIAAAILEPQHIFQQHLQAHRQARHVTQSLRSLGQAEVEISFAVHDQRGFGVEGVLPGDAHLKRVPLPCRRG